MPVKMILLGTACALGLAGCGDQATPESGEASVSAVDPLVDAAFLDAEPEGAISVQAVRSKVQPGAEVTVVGRIAGALNPFAEGYATLVLADESLETCERIPGDSCSTPWDACCADPEVIKASRISVQVTNQDGSPVEQSLKGAGGLTELDTIVVTGKVAEGSTAANVIIDATGIFRKTP